MWTAKWGQLAAVGASIRVPRRASVAPLGHDAAVPFTGNEAKPALLDEVANIEKHKATWTLIGVLAGAAGGLLVVPARAHLRATAAESGGDHQ
jgi:hypothetical protein